jgi:iron complex transport system permease protein
VNNLRPTALLALLALLTLAALGASILIGTVALTPAEAWHALTGREHGLAQMLVLDLRLPRALSAFAVGGLLAVAGVLMQVLLRNPLADPYVMGVSGGAAVAALAVMLLGASGLLVDAGATLGALAASLLVYGLSRGPQGWTPARLLLTGIVIAAGTSAMVSSLLALGDDSRLRGMLFWLMGDLSFSTRYGYLLLLLAGAVLLCVLLGRHLNVLSSGELKAQGLGVPVQALRMGIFALSSLLTAASVTVAGTIGFVGLVTPHLARLMLGSDHRRVIPASVLLGGTLLMLADLFARTAFSPRQLPVGALTALAGVPLFLALLRRDQRRRQ